MAEVAYLAITERRDAIPYGCSISGRPRPTNVDGTPGRADNRRGRVEKARLGVDKCGEAVAARWPRRGANGKRAQPEFHKM